jgi:hypothetical protein
MRFFLPLMFEKGFGQTPKGVQNQKIKTIRNVEEQPTRFYEILPDYVILCLATRSSVRQLEGLTSN